jgi:hypothetical protein
VDIRGYLPPHNFTVRGSAHHPTQPSLPIENTNKNSLSYPQKPNFRHACTPGRAIFLTLGTFNRSARTLILTWDIMKAGYSRLFYDFRS